MTADDLKQTVTRALRPVTTGKYTVNVDQDGAFFAVLVRPSPRDVARLIGAKGANFQAMRTILEHAGQKQGVRVRYYVKDPDHGSQAAPSAPPALETFDPTEVKAIAKAILALAGYSTNILVVHREQTHIISTAATLPPPFDRALERWLSVCARSQGGSVTLDADSIPA